MINTLTEHTVHLASMSAMNESRGSSLESLDESSSFSLVAAFSRSRVGLPGAGWYSSSDKFFWSSSSSSKYLPREQFTTFTMYRDGTDKAGKVAERDAEISTASRDSVQVEPKG